MNQNTIDIHIQSKTNNVIPNLHKHIGMAISDTKWTGVESPILYKLFSSPRIQFSEIMEWGTNILLPDFVVVTKATESSEVKVHGVLYFGPMSYDSPSDFGENIQTLAPYVDSLWIVLTHFEQQIIDETPEWIGVLQVVNSKPQVLRQAQTPREIQIQSGNLAKALLTSNL